MGGKRLVQEVTRVAIALEIYKLSDLNVPDYNEFSIKVMYEII